MAPLGLCNIISSESSWGSLQNTEEWSLHCKKKLRKHAFAGPVLQSRAWGIDFWSRLYFGITKEMSWRIKRIFIHSFVELDDFIAHQSSSPAKQNTHTFIYVYMSSLLDTIFHSIAKICRHMTSLVHITRKRGRGEEWIGGVIMMKRVSSVSLKFYNIFSPTTTTPNK